MALVRRLLFDHQTLRDLKRVIHCERGVASVANCAYPLRYLGSRLSLVLTQGGGGGGDYVESSTRWSIPDDVGPTLGEGV